MIHYVARPACPPLAKLVEYVWASQGAPAHAQERVVPTGTVELIVNLADDSFPKAVVSGPYRRSFTFETRAEASVVGAHLRPGCAGRLLGLPANELGDQHVDLEALWGPSAHELRDRLCAAATTADRFAILETELVSRLDERALHPAVGYALDHLTRGGARIADIAGGAQLSQRRLIELFSTAVGLTPKRFGRIARFHRATALARRGSLSWARVAHACGYYDQAHLIREFRELAEVTPRDLVRASRHAHEHHQLAVL